jgi:purine-nucleoside phosphorylase
MLELHDQIEQAAAAIRATWSGTPKAGKIAVEAALDYEQIPNFPKSTAASHRGRLVCGQLAGLSVVAMEGRVHAYEGYSLKQITLPVRVIRKLGAELLVVSNAVGGLNPNFDLGEIMVIDDHINLMGDNPLVGINDDRLGPRFPDMCEPYDRELIDVALAVARRGDFVAHRGVLAAVMGPNLETRAEYRYLRTIGADAVGMSTVPEVLVARHCGLAVVGFSVVTDMGLPDALEPAEIDQIIATANAAEPKLLKLVTGVLAHVAGGKWRRE